MNRNNKILQITLRKCLSVSTFVVCLLILIFYLVISLNNGKTFIEIINVNTNSGIFWVFILFIALGNISLIENAVIYVLKDKVDKLVSDGLDNKLNERIEYVIKNSPDMIDKSKYAAINSKTTPREDIPNVNK